MDDADTLTPPSEAEITLTEPRRIDVSYQAYQFPNGFNISVFGACNGSIDVTVTDGVSPYTYSWKDGPTTQDRGLVCASTYKVMVTDLNGCIAFSENIIMKEPERGDWQLGGNNSLDPTTQFIGTTDNSDLSFRTNNIETFRLKSDGKINIGSFSGSTPSLVYSDSLGTLYKIPFNLPNQSCAGSLTTPWQQSPYHWEDVFSCFRRFGIGTDQPREKLEVKGSMIVSAWDVSMNNMADYIQFKHDGGNARIENFGTGDLLINPENSKNVKIGTEPGGGYFQTGFGTFLATDGGNVGIGTITPSGYKLDVNGAINFSDDILHNGNSILGGIWNYANNNIFYNGGNVGIATSNPKEALQIGDRFTIHNFTSKVIGYNFFYDLGDKKLVTDESSAIYFTEDGNIVFNTSPLGNQYDPISWTSSIYIQNDGKVAIGGTPDIDHKFTVCGGIRSTKVKVTALGGWCDFVFDEDYNLPALNDVKSYIKENKHLPGVPSGKEIENNGLDLGEMVKIHMQKIEEITLYLIDIQEENKKLKERISELESR